MHCLLSQTEFIPNIFFEFSNATAADNFQTSGLKRTKKRADAHFHKQIRSQYQPSVYEVAWRGLACCVLHCAPQVRFRPHNAPKQHSLTALFCTYGLPKLSTSLQHIAFRETTKRSTRYSHFLCSLLTCKTSHVAVHALRMLTVLLGWISGFKLRNSSQWCLI